MGVHPNSWRVMENPIQGDDGGSPMTWDPRSPCGLKGPMMSGD